MSLGDLLLPELDVQQGKRHTADRDFNPEGSAGLLLEHVPLLVH